MGNLPNWVLDLVADLLDEEDIHPKLFFQRAGDEWVQYGWCPATVLERVPEEAKTAALTVRSYQQREASAG